MQQELATQRDIEAFCFSAEAEDLLALDHRHGAEGGAQGARDADPVVHEHGEELVLGELLPGLHHAQLLQQRGRQELQRHGLLHVQRRVRGAQHVVQRLQHAPCQLLWRRCLDQPSLQISSHHVTLLGFLLHHVQGPTDLPDLGSQERQAGEDDDDDHCLLQLVLRLVGPWCWGVLRDDPVEAHHVLKKAAMFKCIVSIYPVCPLAQLTNSANVENGACQYMVHSEDLRDALENYQVLRELDVAPRCQPTFKCRKDLPHLGQTDQPQQAEDAEILRQDSPEQQQVQGHQ
mmetsp:Transcript_22801/g.54273  ORF Transcript_22801/g.54273 Transcript_22801/m.54273 type:complete len:289 (-) Transcript_22801:801-1667(-)